MSLAKKIIKSLLINGLVLPPMEKANTPTSSGRVAKTRSSPGTSRCQAMPRPRPTNPATATPTPRMIRASLPTLDGQYQSEGNRSRRAA